MYVRKDEKEPRDENEDGIMAEGPDGQQSCGLDHPGILLDLSLVML